MTVIAFLSVSPVREGSLAPAVADAVDALDDFEVTYETTPMGTTIETDGIGELLDAVEAAHESVDGDRVSTFLKIDDRRASESDAPSKVDRVEAELGRPPRRDR
ncbi:MAG: MTH1187 family thiamine-binding protein [Halanaeroarchaeum sp.]